VFVKARRHWWHSEHDESTPYPHNLFKFHFNIVLPFKPRLQRSSFLSGFPANITFHLLIHTTFSTNPSLSSLFKHPNMSIRYFVCLSSIHSPQLTVLKQLQRRFVPHVGGKVSHPYRPPSEVTVSCISVLRLLDRIQEDKRSWTERAAIILRTESVHDICVNVTLTCYSRSEIVVLRHRWCRQAPLGR
jgi:hypothetical protein